MLKEIDNNNTLWFESRDGLSTLLLVTYDSRDPVTKEQAEAGSLLQSEIRDEKRDDFARGDIVGLDLPIKSIPESLGKHLMSEGIMLYGPSTRVILRAFSPTPNGGLKQIIPPAEMLG